MNDLSRSVLGQERAQSLTLTDLNVGHRLKQVESYAKRREDEEYMRIFITVYRGILVKSVHCIGSF